MHLLQAGCSTGQWCGKMVCMWPMSICRLHPCFGRTDTVTIDTSRSSVFHRSSRQQRSLWVQTIRPPVKLGTNAQFFKSMAIAQCRGGFEPYMWSSFFSWISGNASIGQFSMHWDFADMQAGF